MRASAMTENIVLMRYVEANSGLYRMLSVIKQRESAKANQKSQSQAA